MGHFCRAAVFHDLARASLPGSLLLARGPRAAWRGAERCWSPPGPRRVTCGKRRGSLSCRGPWPPSELRAYIIIWFKGPCPDGIFIFLIRYVFPPAGWGTCFGFWRSREGLGSCCAVLSSVPQKCHIRQADFLSRLLWFSVLPQTQSGVSSKADCWF